MAIYNAGQLQEILRAAGWPENLLVTMAAIGLAESSGNSNARNLRGEESLGLWQVNMNPRLGRTYSKERLLSDPVYNATVALEIYNRQGLRAWGAYTDGRYRARLPESQRAYTSVESALPVIAQADGDPFDWSLVEAGAGAYSTLAPEGASNAGALLALAAAFVGVYLIVR